MLRGAAALPARASLTATCLSLALMACGGAPDDLREWRPEDHPAPPAVAGEDRAEPPAARDQAAASEARITAALWTAQCARCHGADGRGGGPELPPGAPVPDFTSRTFQASRTDNALAEVVLQGRGMMPAFEGQLSPRQIALLVRHLRGFAAQ